MPIQLPIIDISTGHQILIERLQAKARSGKEAENDLFRLLSGLREMAGVPKDVQYVLRGSQLVPNAPTKEEVDAMLAMKAPAEHPHTIHLNGHAHPEGDPHGIV